MEEFRNRARANLPTVLLTLLSIVQALALEFLWTYVKDTPGLLVATWTNALMWLQFFATLTGLVLIWVVYASHVMRLRWVPTTTDSVYPFAIGLLEFIMIELLGPARIGQWLLCYASIFALMVWVSHRTMRRARMDGANDAFFQSMPPARFRDFYLAFGMISFLAGSGIYLIANKGADVFAWIAVALTTAIAIYQFRDAAILWEQSLSDEWRNRLQ